MSRCIKIFFAVVSLTSLVHASQPNSTKTDDGEHPWRVLRPWEDERIEPCPKSSSPEPWRAPGGPLKRMLCGQMPPSSHTLAARRYETDSVASSDSTASGRSSTLSPTALTFSPGVSFNEGVEHSAQRPMPPTVVSCDWFCNQRGKRLPVAAVIFSDGVLRYICFCNNRPHSPHEFSN